MKRDRFLFIVFFISGFCGLLYQTIWLRMALASFGVITPVVSVVVSVFMLGLSAGSWLGGKWVRQAAVRKRRTALVYYAGIELLIGAGAFVVPFLFSTAEKMLLRLGETGSVVYLACSAAAITVSILPWCILMGATFPAMMAFLKEFDDGDTASFSFLYTANVLGAACGAALTAVALIEMLGFNTTLQLGAALNIGIGLACLLTAREKTQRHDADSSSTAPIACRPNPTPNSAGSLLNVVILFSTGFASMAMEVVWTRAFTPVMTTTIYAFASLLVTYLVATWVGSMTYRKHLSRGLTLPIGQVMGYLAAASFLPILLNDPRLSPNPFIVCISIAPLCMLLGYLTPRLIDADSSGDPERAGKLYAINILGCILGPLAAGYLLLPQIGVRPGLVLLNLPFVVLFFVTFRSWANADIRRNILAAAAVGLLVLSTVWGKSLEEQKFRQNTEVRRDYAATVMSDGEGRDRRMFVNGIPITTMNPVCKVMAHLPAAHLPAKPKNMLVICFGMGTTFRSAMSWDADVYAAELVPSVRDSFGFFFNDARMLLLRPNAHVNIDDGRRFLKRTGEKFDVITVDPPPPVESAGSGLLYTDEFYDAVKLRLSDAGILQQWYPLQKEEDNQLTAHVIARSLERSFPYVRVFNGAEGYGLHFLASMKPIPARSPGELAARLPDAARADLLEWYPAGTTPEQIFESVLVTEYDIHKVEHPSKNLYMRDDQPFNEYYLLRRYFNYPYMSTLAPAILAILVCGVIGVLVLKRPRLVSEV
jgi:spermidine synthase